MSPHSYATKALSYLQEKGQNFELVKPGSYQGGIIKNGAMFHFNFKAKRAGDPSAPVETFFAQVRLFRNPDPFYELLNPTIECCVSLGESDSLPDKADSRGCVYCTDQIYHPVGGFAGLDAFWPIEDWPIEDKPVTDTSDDSDDSDEGDSPRRRSGGHLSPSKDSHFKKKKKVKALRPKHDEWEETEARNRYEKSSHSYATKALSYLQEKGQNFELVKPGSYQGGIIQNGAMFHVNFKAKHAGDPSAPVETFFAQVRWYRNPVCFNELRNPTIECCASLGESDSLPDKADSRGCVYCSDQIHHPVGGFAGLDAFWPIQDKPVTDTLDGTLDDSDDSDEGDSPRRRYMASLRKKRLLR